MGVSCSNTTDRVCAALGIIDGVTTSFEAHYDVENAGVLLSLPFLIENGLLTDIDKYFHLGRTYYRLDHIFILIGFMALARIKNAEQLRNASPGELGKVMGLDRIPECKTLRGKISDIANLEHLEKWSSQLSSSWLGSSEFSGHLYVDGHIRLYHGSQTKLPRHYVSRERLCLRSMVDYWVNDRIGRPFFVISTPTSDGMTKAMQDEIIPRVLSELEISSSKDNTVPLNHHLVLIYDRESYGFKFMWDMRQIGVACQTYHKFPKGKWDEADFRSVEVSLVHGNKKTMQIAEKIYYKKIKDDEKNVQNIKVREIRVLTENGYQTSILSTDYTSDIGEIASHMFARWCQENYFKYMMEHFEIDRLIDHTLQDIDETKSVINPGYRDIETQVKKQASKLGLMQKKIGILTAQKVNLPADAPVKKTEALENEVAERLTELKILEANLAETKLKKKDIDKHIKIEDLPEDQKFKQLNSRSKRFVDTIKMISYRAETAMAILIKPWMNKKKSDARTILRSLYQTSADIIPDKANSILNVRLHTSSSPARNEIFNRLCNFLNETEFKYPGTDYLVKFETI